MADKRKEAEELKSQLEEIQAKLKKLAVDGVPEVSEDVREYVDQASSALKDYVDQSATVVKEKWGEAKEAGVNAGKKAGKYAKENPWHVAAAAALIGMAVASIVRRNHDND